MESRAIALRKALHARRTGNTYASSERAFLTDVFGDAPKKTPKKAAIKPSPQQRPGTFGALAMKGRQTQQEAYHASEAAADEAERFRREERAVGGPAALPIEEQVAGMLVGSEAVAAMQEAAAVDRSTPRVRIALAVEGAAGPATAGAEAEATPGLVKKKRVKKAPVAPPASATAAGVSTFPPPAKPSTSRHASPPAALRDAWVPSSPQAVANSIRGRAPSPPKHAWEPRRIDAVVAQKLATASAKSLAAHRKIATARAATAGPRQDSGPLYTVEYEWVLQKRGM